MKNVFFKLILFLIFITSILIILLSTIGINTKKFNNLITEKIEQSNKDINLNLNKINFKLDIKELSLFLETQNPNLRYKEVIIPTDNIKVYIDFKDLILQKLKIKKINFSVSNLDILQLKKIATVFKPSNFKSLINNNIKKGKFSSDVEFYFDDNNNIYNFIAKGDILEAALKIKDDLIINKINLNYFADNQDILIKNVFGEIDKIKILEGDLRVKLSNEIRLQSNFTTELKLNQQLAKKYYSIFKKNEFIKNITKLETILSNNLSMNFDETLKIKKFNFSSEGEVSILNYKFKNPISSEVLKNDIKTLKIINSKLKSNYSSQNSGMDIEGKYTINDKDYQNFYFKNQISKNSNIIKFDLDYYNVINLDFLNYLKSDGSPSKISSEIIKKNESFLIKKFKLIENKNSLEIKNLKFKDLNFISIEDLIVKTYKDKKKNNDFKINIGKKIVISGSHFDASNLSKIFNKKNNNNQFKNLNKEIAIDIKNVIAPLSDNLKNFKLIGFIKKGKFKKLSAKGDFGNKRYLDISLKDEANKKYLEVFSDLPQPLLTEYNFFKGLTGGTLLFTSVFDEISSNSKLKIENFKVKNAPGMIKLLSLADLGGLADLTRGEGLSFDVLEISISKEKNLTKFDEIFAVGPSISVLMDGYQERNGLTSLRGTLVPAKNLNKLISKIPVIGEIVVPKEVGEGLFGISFKIKGPKGKVKTTINPIRTITPRFIQKIIDRKKNSK